MQTATNVRHIRTPETISADDGMQGFLHRWFMPKQETQMVATQAKGVFLPYPLLAILMSIAMLLLGGVITLEVQVNNLSVTMLLRDADSRAIAHDMQEKMGQLEVYIHDDREKLIRLQTQAEQDKGKRR